MSAAARKWLRPAALLVCTALAVGQASAYCRDYQPSIEYLVIPLPAALVDPGKDRFAVWRNDPEVSEVTKLNLPVAPLFSQAGLRFALIVNFVQQMTFAALADDEPLLASLQMLPLDRSITYAMGFGTRGTRLREPGQAVSGLAPFHVELLDTDDVWLRSDASQTVFVSRGVVRNIVRTSLAHAFGSVENYVHFIEKILGKDAPAGKATSLTGDVRYSPLLVDPTAVPLGEILSNAAASRDGLLKPFAVYSEYLVGQLLFVGAHEIAHNRLGHWDSEARDCPGFIAHERAADAFAASVLADFNFSMTPLTGEERGRITDFAPFFLNYREMGFTNEDLATACAYDSAETRRAHVEAAYNEAVSDLVARTYSAPDYATPFPNEVICRDGDRKWRQPLK